MLADNKPKEIIMNKFDNVVLGNELSRHLDKKLNRLSSYKFFLVLYRNNPARMLLVNLMLVLLCIPVYYIYMMASVEIYTLSMSLPTYNMFALSSGLWTEVHTYIADNSLAVYQANLWKCALCGLTLTFALSGILAIFRDAFWTGKIVVFSAFIKGITANFLYAFFSAIIICAMVSRLIVAYWFLYPTMAVWLGVIVLVLLGIVAVFVTIFLMILCSVTVTYRQSVARSFADSWYIFITNIPPHLFKFCLAMLPVIIMLALPSLQTFTVMIMLFVGMFYIAFIWQTHMMQIFAIKHPITPVKKGSAKAQQKAKA